MEDIRSRGTDYPEGFLITENIHDPSYKVRTDSNIRFLRSFDGISSVNEGLDIIHQFVSPPVDFSVMAADRPGSNYDYHYHGWSIVNTASGLLPPPVSPASMLADVNGFLTRTNPSKPDVSLPVFLGEFRDLPSQIYNRGVKALQKGDFSLKENSSLGIQFGILPMVSDVMKLMRLAELTERKAKQLERLFRKERPTRPWHKSGMRIRKPVGSKSGKQKEIIIPSTPGSQDFPAVSHVVTTFERKWVTALWLPDPDFSLPTLQSDKRELAQALALGISDSRGDLAFASDLWQLMPWSWLVDWFGDFSQSVERNLGRGLAKCDGAHYMHHRFLSVTSTTESGQSQTYTYEHKSRRFILEQFTMGVPVLTGRQVSILSDLLFSRGYKPNRKVDGWVTPPVSPQ